VYFKAFYTHPLYFLHLYYSGGIYSYSYVVLWEGELELLEWGWLPWPHGLVCLEAI